MRKVALRLPDHLWAELRRYGEQAGLQRGGHSIDISETLRDVLRRGLNGDRSPEAGYLSGYWEGRLAGYAAVQRALGLRLRPPPGEEP